MCIFLFVLNTTKWSDEHGVLWFNSEVEGTVLLAVLHLLPKVFVVQLGVDPHENRNALVDAAILLHFEQHVL